MSEDTRKKRPLPVIQIDKIQTVALPHEIFKQQRDQGIPIASTDALSSNDGTSGRDKRQKENNGSEQGDHQEELNPNADRGRFFFRGNDASNHVEKETTLDAPASVTRQKSDGQQQELESRLQNLQQHTSCSTRGPQKNHELWNFGWEALKRYKETHGHTRVPQTFDDGSGFKLGPWVKRQRGGYSRMKRGLSSFGLDSERIKKLNELDFEWVSKRGKQSSSAGSQNSDGGMQAPPRTRTSHDERWQAKFEALLRYKNKHMHTLVPRAFEDEDGVKLGNWVSDQKAAYSRLMRGLPTVGLTQQRIEQLNGIGFCWPLVRGPLLSQIGSIAGQTASSELPREPARSIPALAQKNVRKEVREEQAFVSDRCHEVPTFVQVRIRSSGSGVDETLEDSDAQRRSVSCGFREANHDSIEEQNSIEAAKNQNYERADALLPLDDNLVEDGEILEGTEVLETSFTRELTFQGANAYMTKPAHTNNAHSRNYEGADAVLPPDDDELEDGEILDDGEVLETDCTANSSQGASAITTEPTRTSNASTGRLFGDDTASANRESDMDISLEEAGCVRTNDFSGKMFDGDRAAAHRLASNESGMDISEDEAGVGPATRSAQPEEGRQSSPITFDGTDGKLTIRAGRVEEEYCIAAVLEKQMMETLDRKITEAERTTDEACRASRVEHRSDKEESTLQLAQDPCSDFFTFIQTDRLNQISEADDEAKASLLVRATKILPKYPNGSNGGLLFTLLEFQNDLVLPFEKIRKDMAECLLGFSARLQDLSGDPNSWSLIVCGQEDTVDSFLRELKTWVQKKIHGYNFVLLLENVSRSQPVMGG